MCRERGAKPDGVENRRSLSRRGVYSLFARYLPGAQGSLSRGWGAVRQKGKLTMRSLLLLVAICFSATAFAQSAPPKVGNKSLVQVKPKETMGCKLVGSVRGTKLWAGDCVGSELRGSTTTTETQSLPQQATGAITPDQKE